MAQGLKDEHLVELELVLSVLRSRSQSKYELTHWAVDLIAKTEQLRVGQVSPAHAAVLRDEFAQRVEHLVEHLESAKDRLAGEENGVLGLDAVFAEYLVAEFGDEGKKVAVVLGERARQAWASYKESPRLHSRQALFGRWKEHGPGSSSAALGELVWNVLRHDEPALAAAEAKLAAESAKKQSDVPGGGAEVELQEKVPAIASGVLQAIVAAFWAPGRTVKRPEKTAFVMNAGKVVAQFNFGPTTTEKQRQALVDSLGVAESIHAHRLLRWLLAQVAPTGERKVELSGGLDALASELGAKGAKVSGILRKLLDLFQAVELRLPDSGWGRSLLSWSLTPAAKGRPAKLTIEVDDALLPAYVALMGKSLRQREAKKLVPVPMQLPPLVGHTGTHGAQAALQLLLLEEFRKQAPNLATKGYAIISNAAWEAMFRKVGVPLDLTEYVINRWVSIEGPDGAFLWRDDEDPGHAFRLGNLVGAAHALVIEAGKHQNRGRQALKRGFGARLKGKKK